MPDRDSGAAELSPAQWERLEQVLAELLEAPPAARAAMIDAACAGDDHLRLELESLLVAHDRPGVLDLPLLQRPDTQRLAAGTTIAQYEIVDWVGGGGMGVVYRARDTRLERTVALKLMSSSMSADAGAKRRFLVEARAAAGFDHPNVCAIHEIGETPDGQLFIAMAFIEGESLRRVLDRQSLSIARAIDITRQLASALHAAHEHGIVHRDVKPANVMLARDGRVQLVDFGVAKLEGSTLTGTGDTPGTMSYMAPEQVLGEPVDRRADVWALGVVLHEMIAGSRPFAAKTDAATLHAITSAAPNDLFASRPDVPHDLERVVSRALEKRPEKRFATAEDLGRALEAIGRRVEPRAPHTRLAPRTRHVVAIGLVLLVAAGAVAGLRAIDASRKSRAHASMGEIARLVDVGAYREADRLVQEAARWFPDDTVLQRLSDSTSDLLSVTTSPPGARVFVRLVRDDGSLAPDSIELGTTPLERRRLTRADYRVDVRLADYAPEARIASSALARAEASLGVPRAIELDIPLRVESRDDVGMALVPGSAYALVGRGAPTRQSVELPSFLVDQYEVTNEQFKAFVAAGGYREQRYWEEPFLDGGKALSWEQGIARFVDRTGLPSPRGWSGQEYAAGEARRPVTGITWYEAAAFARYAGKRLPTVFEWEKAARDGRFTHFDQVVMPWGLADPAHRTSRRANFSGSGLEDVDRHPSGISPFGVYNMAGNAEEWTANPSGEKRLITGGAWDDPMYVFSNFLSVSAWHASPSLGFRCVRAAPGTTGDPGSFEIPPAPVTPTYRPVDDATYASLLRHYAYDRTPLEPVIEDSLATADWTRQTISILGPWRDRTTLYVYLPRRAARPYQAIVFLPGTNTFLDVALPDETEHLMGAHVKAGRAVVAVRFKGMVGRPWDAGRTVPATSSVQYRQEMIMHATEMRRAIDYLETRTDIDRSRLAYVGFSKGSGSWIPLAAIEPRFRSVVFIGGGIDETFASARPEVLNVNFAPHIRAPTLLLNGQFDEEHPWDRRGAPLWNLLREPRRLEIVDGGHLPRAEARVPVINRWLDETMGSVR